VDSGGCQAEGHSSARRGQKDSEGRVWKRWNGMVIGDSACVRMTGVLHTYLPPPHLVPHTAPHYAHCLPDWARNDNPF